MQAESIYNTNFVKALFNRISGTYDTVNFVSTLGASGIIRRYVLRKLEASNKPLEVLDLMAGKGQTWPLLQKKFPNAHITAIDLSEEMVRLQQQKNALHHNNQITILQQDVLNNSLAGQTYDVVISGFGIKHFDLQQLQVLASETRRILKPNGYFFFFDIAKPQTTGWSLLFNLYFKRVLPNVAWCLGSNKQDYNMLWEYSNQLPSAAELQNLCTGRFATQACNTHFFGLIVSISGSK